MDEDVFYKDGLNFSCKQCSHCCRVEPGVVYLSLEDLKNLCDNFSMSPLQFSFIYCRWLTYYDGEEVLGLKEKPNYDCILWKDGGCTAYKSRPVQCSTYPFWSWILESRKDWDGMKKDCPGINEGRLWTFDEIKTEKAKYDAITPLHRKDFEKMFMPLIA